MTKMKLQIAHQVPGRIRMKVPSAKENPELLEQIKQTFSVIPGIEDVTVNPTTGSVVLHYDADRHDEFHGRLQHHTGGHYKPPANEIDALATKIEQEAEYLAEHSHTARMIVDFFKDFDNGIKVATGNVVDLKILLATGIAGFTIFEVGANAATPVWVTLAIFALNHMIQANMRDAEQAEPEGAAA
ncbi:HMA2 domain-containing protein [Bradyrhizobium viridifuturi]|uniref:HMA2 domain-containing protein n=1 Tax=Bradyrhizobium viridifuturi TaxID=1654716 RepID=UPI00067E722D|nr:heavy-metal-associated domain-containing protein [Bradyrhizobium viridifuturi]